MDQLKLHELTRLQANKSSFQAWKCVSFGYSLLALVLLTSKLHEVSTDLRLLMGIDQLLWQVAQNQHQSAADRNASSTLTGSNQSAAAVESMPLPLQLQAASSLATMSNDSSSLIDNIEDLDVDSMMSIGGGGGNEANSSSSLGSENGPLNKMVVAHVQQSWDQQLTGSQLLRQEVEAFVSEFRSAKSTLGLSSLLVSVYILSWILMTLAVNDTKISNDISLRNILLLSVFGAIDMAASLGFVLVRLIMFNVKNKNFVIDVLGSSSQFRDHPISAASSMAAAAASPPAATRLTADQLTAFTALRLIAMRSSSAYIDIYVSVLVAILTLLRLYAVLRALDYYRNLRRYTNALRQMDLFHQQRNGDLALIEGLEQHHHQQQQNNNLKSAPIRHYQQQQQQQQQQQVSHHPFPSFEQQQLVNGGGGIYRSLSAQPINDSLQQLNLSPRMLNNNQAHQHHGSSKALGEHHFRLAPILNSPSFSYSNAHQQQQTISSQPMNHFDQQQQHQQPHHIESMTLHRNVGSHYQQQQQQQQPMAATTSKQLLIDYATSKNELQQKQQQPIMATTTTLNRLTNRNQNAPLLILSNNNNHSSTTNDGQQPQLLLLNHKPTKPHRRQLDAANVTKTKTLSSPIPQQQQQQQQQSPPDVLLVNGQPHKLVSAAEQQNLFSGFESEPVMIKVRHEHKSSRSRKRQRQDNPMSSEENLLVVKDSNNNNAQQQHQPPPPQQHFTLLSASQLDKLSKKLLANAATIGGSSATMNPATTKGSNNNSSRAAKYKLVARYKPIVGASLGENNATILAANPKRHKSRSSSNHLLNSNSALFQQHGDSISSAEAGSSSSSASSSSSSELGAGNDSDAIVVGHHQIDSHELNGAATTGRHQTVPFFTAGLRQMEELVSGNGGALFNPQQQQKTNGDQQQPPPQMNRQLLLEKFSNGEQSSPSRSASSYDSESGPTALRFSSLVDENWQTFKFNSTATSAGTADSTTNSCGPQSNQSSPNEH